MAHRYIRPQKRTVAPVHLAIVAPEYNYIVHSNGRVSKRKRADSVFYTYGVRNGPLWGGSSVPRQCSVEEWWALVDAVSTRRKPLYVVSYRATDFACASGLLRHTTKGRYRCNEGGIRGDVVSGPVGGVGPVWMGSMVLSEPPTIMQFRGDRCAFKLVSLGNFLDMTLDQIARAIGYEYERTVADNSRDATTHVDAYDECSIITSVMRDMVSRWIVRGCGNWRDTIAQQSMSIWRKKHYGHPCCKHDDKDVADMEARALHGGRNSVWCYLDCGWRVAIDADWEPPPPPSVYGSLPTMSYKCDVRAMHASILRDHIFPTRLLSSCCGVTPAELKSILRYDGAIATVEIKCNVPEYPLNNGLRTIYPTGHYITTLAGPELIQLCEMGAVKRVHAMARYELGEPFRSFAEGMLAERMQAKDAKDRIGELVAKQTANSFVGKLAQRRGMWERMPSMTGLRQWGEWLDMVYGTDAMERYRAIAGSVYRWNNDPKSIRLLAAAYSYVTSYCRIRMKSLRQVAGADTVLSQCTDGIWVTQDGLDRVRSTDGFGSGKPGTPSLDGQSVYTRFLAANHYYANGTWTLAGYILDHDVTSDLTIVERQRVNPLSRIPSRAPTHIYDHRRIRRMTELKPDTPVTKDGWARPVYISSPACQSAAETRPSDWQQR